MVDAKEKAKGEKDELHEEVLRIRMTLRGRDVKPLEDCCSEIVSRCKEQNYRITGPKRIPTKTLTITCRRSPCGNGTNTYDHFEMRIHKRVIDIYCPSSVVKDITAFRIDPSVDVGLQLH